MQNTNKAAHVQQRVAIFIDTQNLYHSAKSNFRTNVNYDELIAAAVGERALIRAFAYVIKTEDNTEEKFIDALEDIGIEIRIKDLQIFHTGVKKADWDVGIAVDMIRMSEKVDVVVLASGDGDFLEVMRFCQSRGVRVEVMAFDKTSNDKLVEEADHFCDLGAENGRYLIGRRPIKKIAGEGFSSPRSAVTAPQKTTFQRPAPSSFVRASQTQMPTTTRANANELMKPSYLREKENKVISPVFGGYSSQNKRPVKPVVGLPVRKKNSFRRKNSPPSRFSINNAFGNNPPSRPGST